MKHLHEEAQLIGSMCLRKPHQCMHIADEQARILTASNVTSSSYPLKIKMSPGLYKPEIS